MGRGAGRRHGKNDVCGMILADKPKGWTSAQVVYRIRSKLKAKKVGHGGTLDPLATGLLQIFLGEATKTIPFLEGEKEYTANALFGLETDTHDTDGKVLREVPVPPLTREQVEEELGRFMGTTSQLPPKISAARYHGERLYNLTRRGIDAPRRAKDVHIKELEITSFELPRMSFRIVCSRGTYLRGIVRDLGETLGVPIVLEGIRRTRIGSFHIEDALPPDESISKILPQSRGLQYLGGLSVGEGAARRIRQGQSLVRGEYSFLGQTPKGGDLVRILTNDDELVAVAHYHADGFARIKRVFMGVPRRALGAPSVEIMASQSVRFMPGPGGSVDLEGVNK